MLELATASAAQEQRGCRTHAKVLCREGEQNTLKSAEDFFADTGKRARQCSGDLLHKIKLRWKTG